MDNIDLIKNQSKKIYISGPMTGIKNNNHDTFNYVATLIRYIYQIECFSPSELFEGRTDMLRSQYMFEDIKGLLSCDSIVMLDGWQNSKGALLELEIAKEIDLKIYRWYKNEYYKISEFKND